MTLLNQRLISTTTCSQATDSRNALRWDLTTDQIKSMTESLIQRIKQVYDNIGSLDIEKVSIDNTLNALASAKLEYACKCRQRD